MCIMPIVFCIIVCAHVQVAGVVGRAETLSSVFFLSCLFTYKKACSREDSTSECSGGPTQV